MNKRKEGNIALSGRRKYSISGTNPEFLISVVWLCKLFIHSLRTCIGIMFLFAVENIPIEYCYSLFVVSILYWLYWEYCKMKWTMFTKFISPGFHFPMNNLFDCFPLSCITFLNTSKVYWLLLVLILVFKWTIYINKI